MATWYIARLTCTLWWQVTIILSSPCWWTLSFSWNHESRSSGRSIADSTGHIVLTNITNWTRSVFIFSTVYMRRCRYSSVKTSGAIKVVRIIRKTKLFCSSSLNVPKSSTCPTSIDQLSSSNIWTRCPSPPDVGNSDWSYSKIWHCSWQYLH